MQIDIEALLLEAIPLLNETVSYLTDAMNYSISIVSYIPEDFKYINTLSDYSSGISDRLVAVNNTITWLNKVIDGVKNAQNLSMQEINKLGETTLNGDNVRISLAGKDENGNIYSKREITGEEIGDETSAWYWFQQDTKKFGASLGNLGISVFKGAANAEEGVIDTGAIVVDRAAAGIVDLGQIGNALLTGKRIRFNYILGNR